VAPPPPLRLSGRAGTTSGPDRTVDLARGASGDDHGAVGPWPRAVRTDSNRTMTLSGRYRHAHAIRPYREFDPAAERPREDRRARVAPMDAYRDGDVVHVEFGLPGV